MQKDAVWFLVQVLVGVWEVVDTAALVKEMQMRHPICCYCFEAEKSVE